MFHVLLNHKRYELTLDLRAKELDKALEEAAALKLEFESPSGYVFSFLPQEGCELAEVTTISPNGTVCRTRGGPDSSTMREFMTAQEEAGVIVLPQRYIIKML